MPFRDRLVRMRMRLRHCNIVAAAFLVALVGMWDELKPLIQDFVANYISPQNVGILMTGLGILVIFVRAGVAMAPLRKDDDEERH